jgi:tyrosyl-tRNA synthetase
MSVSAFHGGLEWREPLQTAASQSPSGGLNDTIEAVTSASSLASIDALSSRDINEFFNPRVSELSLEQRFDLCKSVGEEVILEEDLMDLLRKKDQFRCYDGFEPSGRMHIA